MWIGVSLIAYLANALVYVADKFLLSKKIHSSITYAFFVGIWSVFNLVLLFIDPWFPNISQLAIDLFAGIIFLLTLVFWYKALHQSEATRVVPIVGALVPIFSFLLSFIFLGETLTERQFLAFIILINGGILISVKHTHVYMFSEFKNRLRDVFGNVIGPIHAHYRPTQRLFINSIVSAFFFAAYYVLIKHIYSTQPFIGGFVWSRMGSFIGTLFILVVPSWRKLIIKQQKGQKSPKNLLFFFSVRLLAAAAFIILNWAVSMGNVALINSLQGAQYIFLTILIIVLSQRYPKLIKEEMGNGVLLQKILGTSLVTIGLYMLIIS